MTNKLLAVLCVLAGAAAGPAAASNLKPVDPAALQRAVEEQAAEMMLPGAMVVLRTPGGDFAFGYGATERGGATPPDAGTHFRIASNTKTITAAVTVLLAQEGRLRLDDPVSRYVAGVPDGDAITIENLLKMRSGLYNFTDAPQLAASLETDPTRVWTPEELLALAFAEPPNFAPDAEFEYSNTNYLLLGLVIEEIEGRPLADVFHARLFEPLGMADTLLPEPASNAIPAPFARGYIYGGPEYALVDTPYPPALQAEARAGTLAPEDETDQNPSYAGGAGGAISTADDLAAWMDALVGGELFDPEWHRLWLDSPEAQDPGAPEGQKYGYGISKVAWGPNRLYFHGGEMPGYNSFMGHDPVSDMTLVIWTTLTVSLDGRPTANTMMLRLLEEIYVEPPGR